MSFDIGNDIPTSIRTTLIVALVLSTAGCTLNSNIDDTPSEDSSPTPECKLTHEMVEPSGNYADATESYAYGNLSSEAQHVFEAALDGGSYSTTNQSLKPTEFRYWDTAAIYNITHQNETYTLLTYTGAGCE